MDTPNNNGNNNTTHPPFGGTSSAELSEWLDLLAIVFHALATADSPRTLQARMMTAAGVLRDHVTMDAPPADVFVRRLTFNTRAAYAQRSQASRPLVQPPAAEAPRYERWEDSQPHTPPQQRRKTGR